MILAGLAKPFLRASLHIFQGRELVIRDPVLGQDIVLDSFDLTPHRFDKVPPRFGDFVEDLEDGFTKLASLFRIH